MERLPQQLSITGLEKTSDAIRTEIEALRSTTNGIKLKVDSIDDRIKRVDQEVMNLRQAFHQMAEDQKKAANLQRAISELIRVRQEIDQKYGNYTLIRQTMLGVLQATDSALVKKTTISKVSEELMLSTPQYWLAPCLVAVAGWISNDRELAERAIKEAMKRDAEKTALAMALICRRNGRIETGYEWLSIYFEKQSAINFSEESFTYIDAYVNGVFGPDTRQACQGYVAKWIDEVRGNKSSFEESQVERWREYCSRFSKDTSKEFPDLARAVPEYGRINNCLGAIQALGDIRAVFRGIMDAFVDQEAMKKAVDAELVRLIGNYDSAEESIRKEEEYLSLIKYFGGDEDKAKAEMKNREAKRLKRKLDFIEKMSSEITSRKETTPSKKKTAVTFLGTYINQGANQYVAVPKADFPQEITVNIGAWSGRAKDGSELERLSREYEGQMEQARTNEIKYADNSTPRLLLIFSVVCFAMALVSLVAIPSVTIAVMLTLAGAGLLLYRVKAKADIVKNIERINDSYNEAIIASKEELKRVLEQWVSAKTMVESFDEKTGSKVVVA